MHLIQHSHWWLSSRVVRSCAESGNRSQMEMAWCFLYTLQLQQPCMPFPCQSFRHDVCKHVSRGAVFHNCFLRDIISDKLKLNIDMFHFCMMRDVLGECNGSLIVAEENCWRLGRHSDVLHEGLEPDHLFAEGPSRQIRIQPSREQRSSAFSLATKWVIRRTQRGIRISVWSFSEIDKYAHEFWHLNAPFQIRIPVVQSSPPRSLQGSSKVR